MLPIPLPFLLHYAAASERALAKAVVRVATEVEADLIVLKTHGRKRPIASNPGQHGRRGGAHRTVSSD